MLRTEFCARRTWLHTSSLVLVALGLVLARCTPSSTGQGPVNAGPASAPAPQPAQPATAPGVAVADDARGGRLFDNFRAEKKLGESFVPDSAKTPEPDGKGGPNGNGTLNNVLGQPMANTGHDYRLKNLFGWDLRGAQGLYGSNYHNKAFVLQRNLLTDTRSAAELKTWLEKGDAETPAYGAVLDNQDLEDVVAFLLKTRNRELAQPDEIFQLDAAAPKTYRLNPGADAAAGYQRYAQACAECHGADGMKLKIDDTHSVGSISRSSGYEIWFKIQHGQPGSNMGRQVNEGSGAANSKAVLELLAALCDRTRFPQLPGQEDVADGDARCGSYLK